MSYTPSFLLPACPTCSTIVSVDRPFWRVARNVSKARGRDVFHIIGCAHAKESFGETKLYDDPETIELVEEVWTARAEELFAVKVERWGPSAIDAFRRELAGGLSKGLPGSTGTFDFGGALADAVEEKRPTPGTVEYDEETELIQEAEDAMRNARFEPPPRVIRDPSSGDTFTP
jgi:hypothetical protein